MADVDVEAEVEGGGAIVVMLGILTMKLCAQHSTLNFYLDFLLHAQHKNPYFSL